MITFPAGSCMAIPRSSGLAIHSPTVLGLDRGFEIDRGVAISNLRSLISKWAGFFFLTKPYGNLQSAIALGVGRQPRQMADLGRLAKFAEQTGEVERLPAERERALIARPFASRPIPRQFQSIKVGIVQVNRLVRTMVRCAVDAPAAVQQPNERRGQVAARRVVDREMVQPGCATSGRRSTLAFPGVE